MNLKVDEQHYRVIKRQSGVDEYQYNVIPRRRNCKLCIKGFESFGREFITWTDDNGYLRSGYFCRSCLCLMLKALKVINKNR